MIRADRILCREPDIPVADALVDSVAKRLEAIIVIDEPWFKRVKTHGINKAIFK